MRSKRAVSTRMLAFTLMTISSVALPAAAQAQATVTALLQATHIHGLAIDRSDSTRLLIATHHGLYAARSDGRVQQVSERRDDFMGFSEHPADPTVFIASGHPASGGNLGVILSENGGRKWIQLSQGANGPVDFHQLTISAADPSVIYGVFRGVQRSDDRGKTWRIVGPAPHGVISLAASTQNADTLYAGTERGLLVSANGGISWSLGYPVAAPVTSLKVTPDGVLYAYIVGRGLFYVSEAKFSDWRKAGPELDDDAILHLAIDFAKPARLFAATARGRLLTSDDSGAIWKPFGMN